jgi:type II secretory pathway pseudopilin PulG
VQVSSSFRKARRGGQQGYILLTLVLFTVLIVIAATIVLPEFVFQTKRDREEEMIHRGVQYSRAVRRYYKKFGKYPSTIEELKATQNIHFLRKAYKDPVTGKDFRLLHLTDVQQLMAGAGMMGAVGGMGGANAMGMAGAMGQMTGGAQGLGGGMAQQAMMAQASMAQAAMAMQGQQQQTQVGTSLNGDSPDGGAAKPSGMHFSNDNDKLSGQVFGGGPIVGVASTSKNETIREFNNKNHYKDWQFIYSPMMDRGGLITGPFQPQSGGLGGGSLQAGQNGLQGQPGQSSFGQSGQSSFGQRPGGSSFGGQSSFGSQSSFGQPPQQQPPQQSSPSDQQ